MNLHNIFVPMDLEGAVFVGTEKTKGNDNNTRHIYMFIQQIFPLILFVFLLHFLFFFIVG